MKSNKYAFRDIKNAKDKKDFLEFLRYQTTAEYGGNQIFDGRRSHLLHIPEELLDFILFLKQHEKKTGKKIKRFLEIGYSTGKTNTILNKFFNFEQIVAIDNFSAHISNDDLWGNLSRKKLVLISGNSDQTHVINVTKKFSPFDLILIDGSHEFKDAKNDLEKYSKMLGQKGVLAAHDIHQKDMGVEKAWAEFKLSKDYSYKEIFHKKYYFNCGMGLAIKK